MATRIFNGLFLFILTLTFLKTIAQASDSADDFSVREQNFANDLNSNDRKFVNTSKAKLLTTTGNWRVIKEYKPNNHYVCHAFTHPIKTELFADERATASMIVTYFYPNMYTISVYSGFIMKRKENTILTIDQVQHSMPYNRLSFATTVSSEEDVKIINSMLTTNNHIKIKSFSYDGQVSIDYYSLNGFKNAALYMQAYCSKSGK